MVIGGENEILWLATASTMELRFDSEGEAKKGRCLWSCCAVLCCVAGSCDGCRIDKWGNATSEMHTFDNPTQEAPTEFVHAGRHVNVSCVLYLNGKSGTTQ